MAEKKFKMAHLYYDFSHFTSIIWPCGRYNLEIFHVSSSNFLYMLLISSSQISSIIAIKKIKMADLLWFFSIYVNNFSLYVLEIELVSCIQCFNVFFFTFLYFIYDQFVI